MVKTWRDRLIDAIEADERSPNAISQEANLSRNYISQMRSAEKEPTIPVFLRLCTVLKISPVFILTGVEVAPDSEELLRIYSALPDEDRQNLRSLIARLADGVPQL